MSFTTDIAEELCELPLGKNCCRRALLLGLFYDAKRESGSNELVAVFRTERAAELAYSLLESRFSASAAVERLARAGRTYFSVRTDCAALLQAYVATVGESEKMLFELLGFRCGACRAEFLRGVFIACASVNDPHKGYHMEFSLSESRRADRLAALLATVTEPPRRIRRGSREGLYYKTNGAISDLIYYIGGTKSSFDVANTWIERDIRNQENRATNCVARNISRAVGAAQKHIAAIECLRESGKLFSLSEELRQTAELRVEYDSASLAELASLHTPPITKSGLNQRLTKLLAAARDVQENENQKDTE